MIEFKVGYLKEVNSTNTLLLEYARKGASEGLVLSADYQTGGRGKPGHTWESPVGKNLLFSVLLRPTIKPSEAPILTQTACRAVATVLQEKYDIKCAFKRPNDVVVGSKKICGTLVEASSTAEKLDFVVMGIGLNVNAEASKLPPEGISMKQITGKTYSRDKVLGLILEELKRTLPYG